MVHPDAGILPTIPASCYVDLSAQVIGDVVLGEHSSIWMNAVVRGDVNQIRIGANSNVQDCAVLHGEGVLSTMHSVRQRLDTDMALGYSNAGQILEVGYGVTEFKVGDRVACAGAGYAVHAEVVRVPRSE